MFTQNNENRKGLNPNLQNIAITGEKYYYHYIGGMRIYLGKGTPNEEVEAYPGDTCFTENGQYTCKGDNNGGKGSVWVSSSNQQEARTATAKEEMRIDHYLGYIPYVWFVNDNGEISDISVTDITIDGFTCYSETTGTIYYR